ncbi:MAG: CHAD domain-containing protein [Campylobacterota bacterium]|nr:CHAD domain-containing protein [Campylobacterota bacterium]
MKEIERKYLLNRSILEFLDQTSTSHKKITQFYIKVTPHKSVRFRKYGSRYYKCTKYGLGGVREEIEKEISQKVYKKNLKKRIGRSIKKVRYLFKLQSDEYSVDVYKKSFVDLYVMEVEFESIAAYENYLLHSTLETYVEKEVTDDEAYKNKNLALFGLPYEESEAKENGSVAALMHIFGKLLDDVYFYRGKLLTGGDDEDLHQFRIACRRSVVLMGEFKLLYEEESLIEHRRGLKNLISISNTKRDMDVLMSELYKIEGEMKASHYQEALDILKERVEVILQREHASIITYLQSESCTNVLMAWKNYITDTNRTDISIYGRYPIDTLSKYVIFQRFLKIKKRIKGLDPKHDASETLHKLRIEYKKMRYLLESFGYLYEKKEIKKLLKEMKKLQNVLGLFHDSHQQKMIFEGLLETEENEKVRSFIKEILFSSLKSYQKKEILEIRKQLKEFLKKKEVYRNLFA